MRSGLGSPGEAAAARVPERCGPSRPAPPVQSLRSVPSRGRFQGGLGLVPRSLNLRCSRCTSVAASFCLHCWVVLKAACPYEAVVAGGISGRTVFCPHGAAPGVTVSLPRGLSWIVCPRRGSPGPRQSSVREGSPLVCRRRSHPQRAVRDGADCCGVRPCVTRLSSHAQRCAVSPAAQVGPETGLGAWSGFAELFQLQFLTCFRIWTKMLRF